MGVNLLLEVLLIKYIIDSSFVSRKARHDSYRYCISDYWQALLKYNICRLILFHLAYWLISFASFGETKLYTISIIIKFVLPIQQYIPWSYSRVPTSQRTVLSDDAHHPLRGISVLLYLMNNLKIEALQIAWRHR